MSTQRGYVAFADDDDDNGPRHDSPTQSDSDLDDAASGAANSRKDAAPAAQSTNGHGHGHGGAPASEGAARERSGSFSETLPTASDPNDPRLLAAVALVRTRSSAALKEQCVRTEWGSMTTELERELLVQLVADGEFWSEVKAMAEADVAAVQEDGEDDVDTETRLLQMFKCFDKDHSGTIDRNELHQMMLYMGISATEKEVSDMIAGVDKNGDGDIDEAEFLQVMKAAQAGQLTVQAPTRQNIRRASMRVQAHTESRLNASTVVG